MDAAEAHEHCFFEAWNQLENIFLRAPFQPGLETDEVVVITCKRVLAQLHRRVRPAARAWIIETDRLHGPMPQGLASTIRHHFDGQAGFEKGCVEIMQLRALGFE